MQLKSIDTIVSVVVSIFGMSDNKKKGIYLSYEGIKGLVLASILAYQFINNGLVKEVPSTMRHIEELSTETRLLREDINMIKDVLKRAKLTSHSAVDQISTSACN